MSSAAVVIGALRVKWISLTTGRVVQSAARLTERSDVPNSIRGPAHTFVESNHEICSTAIPPSTDSRRVVVSYWRKYGHLVLVNRLGGLSLPGKSVVRLTDRLDMTIAAYCGH